MLVLWLVVVLGAVAVGVAALSRGESAIVDNVRTRAAARYAAESGIVAATWRLKQLLRAAETPRDQALVFRRLDRVLADVQQESLGATRFQVTVEDLNARIDLNNADEPTLRAFFGQFVSAHEAQAFADALQDWRDADEDTRPLGAEAADYARAGSPFRPPNRPLQRLDEVLRIKGFSDALADRIAPYVTVQGDGRVNLNTASVPVLASLPGFDPATAADLAAQRERGTVFTSLVDVARKQGRDFSLLTTMAHRVLFISRGWQVNPLRPLTHEIQAVYDLDAVRLGQPRLTLRFWRELDR
jgi:general secretion pathway protein K